MIYLLVCFAGPCRSSVPQIRHHCFQMFRAEATIRIMHPFLKGARRSFKVHKMLDFGELGNFFYVFCFVLFVVVWLLMKVS